MIFRWIISALGYVLLTCGALAQVGQIPAYLQPAPSVASYQGPGDVFPSAFGWYSCARAYSAAFAATQGAICQVADVSTGAITCDLHVGTNGFADLTSLSCAGGTLTVPAFCTAHTSCVATKAYDQSGNTRDLVQATLANMPPVVVSGLNSLPVLNCNTGTVFLASSGTFTIAQPFTMSTAYIHNSGAASGGAFGANTNILIGAGSTNTALVNANGSGVTRAATDAAWHGAQGLANGNGTSSVLNIDGGETTGAAGVTGFSANNIRLCRGAGSQLVGSVAEGGLWAVTSITTDRNNLYANQHGANGYNGAL